MNIPVSNFIKIDNLHGYKFHAARWNGSDNPLDVFVRDKRAWRNWNTWRGTTNEFSRQFIFSLIDFYPERDVWLFGGIYEITGRRNEPRTHSYDIREIEEYQPYVGRLKINLKKPPRGRAFYLEKYWGQMSVSEILKESYSGAVFPGYENINFDFSNLEPIFKNENPDWKGALHSVKGIYLIMDKSNGKKYVGSAYGGEGIWSRWNCYMGNGHGHNDELTNLISKEGFGYALRNFRISLLEYRSMKVDDKTIIERENYWKEVLLSRGTFGYNKN